jgi:hypothetical protein
MRMQCVVLGQAQVGLPCPLAVTKFHQHLSSSFLQRVPLDNQSFFHLDQFPFPETHTSGRSYCQSQIIMQQETPFHLKFPMSVPHKRAIADLPSCVFCLRQVGAKSVELGS